MSAKKPLRDYSNSRAILIGTSDYIHLSSVPAAYNSLNRISKVLASDLCGWPKSRITVLANERRLGDLSDRLITHLEEVEDVALFYFVGHGQVDLEDQLCLSLVESRSEPHRRTSTSLPFQAVRQAMLGSPARTKIVILDCCFAGIANKLRNTLGPTDLLDKIAGTGAYTMAACSSYAAAWFENGPRKYAQTYFTKYLADTIEAGISDESSVLPLRVLFGRVRESLATDGHPLPEDRNIDSAGDFLFAHNASPGSTINNEKVDFKARPAADERQILRSVIVDISRRYQSLSERQLRVIDELERRVTTPDELESLFKIDHFATRILRQSENLLILSGQDRSSRQWTTPISLVDIMRGAAAEIEQYDRLVLKVQPHINLLGSAVTDTMHLIAEIMENGTKFSPESTQVVANAQSIQTGGVLIEITDDGVGMNDEELALENWRLDNPQSMAIPATRRMGLFAVGLLAARYGIRVRLSRADSGGVSAKIWLPEKILIYESPQPGSHRRD